MGKRLWSDNNYINFDVSFSDLFKIDENDFDLLLKLYRFKPIRKYLSFYDEKRNTIVAKFLKNPINKNKYDIYFNKNWIRIELLCTNVAILQDICKKYSELYAIQKEYKERKKLAELTFLSSMDNSIKELNKEIIQKLKKGLSDEDYKELISE